VYNGRYCVDDSINSQQQVINPLKIQSSKSACGTWSRVTTKWTILIVSTLTLLGCGGGGEGSKSGSGSQTATGVFKDSNVSGLQYTSGAISGITGTDGSFDYEIGKTITFSIGGVTIGSANGDSTITPVDLVPSGRSSNRNVQNIVRFLMMLDSDGNPRNGIQITPAVREIAVTWSQVDFSTSSLSTALVSISSDAATADSGIHILPNAISAQVHIESTLSCTRAGAYIGNYTGGDNGTFGMYVNPKTRMVSGFAYSTDDNERHKLLDNQPIAFTQKATFTSGITASGTVFTGEFTGADRIAGRWTDNITSLAGSFKGSRLGGTTAAKYRFSGTYEGNDFGVVSFDVDENNNITGYIYSIPKNERASLSGTLNNGQMKDVVTANGTAISGILDTSTDQLVASWADSQNADRINATGRGCQLN